MKIHVAVGRLDRLHSAHNSQMLALWENGEGCQLFRRGKKRGEEEEEGKKRKRRKKTPLKAAHSNEELAGWWDLGKEGGVGVKGWRGGECVCVLFKPCWFHP